MLKTKIFLDLEETVIDTWGSSLLVNTSVVRGFLRDNDAKEVSIFSFAIWDNADKEHFVDSSMKHMLETALEVKIVEWLSVDEIIKINAPGTDRIDYISWEGKARAFYALCKNREYDTTCMLVDDTVDSEVLTVHDKRLEIKLIPVQRLIIRGCSPHV